MCAAGEYDAELRSALLAYKERGRRALAAPLSAYLSDATDVLLRTASPESSGRLQPVLIPVPSRRAAARQRGGDHVLRLARLVARHSQLPVSRALSVSSAVADSAGLSTAARAANLAHQMQAAPPERHQLEAVLLDDIVTTGATLAEAGRALTEAGWRVLGAAVIGATRRRYPVVAGAGTDGSNWADERQWASV